MLGHYSTNYCCGRAHWAKVRVTCALMGDVAALAIRLGIQCKCNQGGCCTDGCFTIQRLQRLAVPKTGVAVSEQWDSLCLAVFAHNIKMRSQSADEQ